MLSDWRARAQFEQRQIGIAEYSHQQIVEVVGDPTGENAEAFQFLSLQNVRFETFSRGDIGDRDNRAPEIVSSRCHIPGQQTIDLLVAQRCG